MTDEEIVGSTDYRPVKTVVLSVAQQEKLRQKILARMRVEGDHWFTDYRFYISKLRIGKKQFLGVRRLVWVLFRNDRPLESFQVRSSCRFTNCLNPDHLELNDHMVSSVHGTDYTEIVLEGSGAEG